MYRICVSRNGDEGKFIMFNMIVSGSLKVNLLNKGIRN